jgi:hypothetical protein
LAQSSSWLCAAIDTGARDPMHSRQMWFRVLSEADAQTCRRWARVVAVCYLLIIVGGVAALAVSSARHVQDGPLLASSRTH